MTIVYAVEKLGAFYQELSLLLPIHWREIALDHEDVPLDTDWDTYFSLDKAGVLHCITVRDEGRLVGYHIALVKGHLHYKSTLHAITDVYFILPSYRKGRIGIKLFQFAEQEFRKLGVKKMMSGTKHHLNIGKVLRWLGWNTVEDLWTKILR